MEEKIKKWLILAKIPHLGNVGIRKLWEHFGSLEGIWKADEQELGQIEGLAAKAIKSFTEYRDRMEVEKDLIALKDVDILTLEDAGYPENLKNIYDPPPLLFLKGNLLPTDQKAIAIVGTRRATYYGISFTQSLASELANRGITIVSGMALGIDSAAHEGALAAKGRTIAVLGCGVDLVYPPENQNLKEEIVTRGAVISEFLPGTKPEAWMFPQRNRLISGLALGVIVVEGHYDSGAMITAKLALDQGREVFAVPGRVESEQSKGPHWLIKQGAKLVESVEDVLEELNLKIPKSQKRSAVSSKQIDYSNFSAEEQKLMSILSFEPKHIDEIITHSGFSASQASSLLMMLEVKELIRQLPGKFFTLI